MSRLSLAPEEALSTLKARLREVATIRTAASVLHWDQATYLPERGAETRGEQLALLGKLAHERATSDEVGKLIETALPLLSGLHPDSDDARYLAVAAEDFERDTKVPSEFHAELMAHSSLTYETWKKARLANEYSLVEGLLEKTLELSRRYCEYLSPHVKPGASIMDPLIDLADPGFTVAGLKPVFENLRAQLVPLLEEIRQSPPFDASCVRQTFDENGQLEFGKRVIRAIGYDFERGRQDKTTHPFMTRLGHSDIRITTRVKPDDLTEALFSSIHEAGHALYELGIDADLDGGPLGHGASSGVHESQSRLWENLVGRGLPFWSHFYPALQEQFPKQLGPVPLQIFHRAINRVEPSLIRTDADEVTYNLHVMIRFDLELELLTGRLAVKDLPEAWNERYRSDLGLVPKTLSEGALQDVHWFSDYIGGVFQGYTIGNILSAQLYAAAKRSLPRLEEEIASGEFHQLREWLRDNLHRHGRKFQGDDLITRATGAPLSAGDYVTYLTTKYQSLIEPTSPRAAHEAKTPL